MRIPHDSLKMAGLINAMGILGWSCNRFPAKNEPRPPDKKPDVTDNPRIRAEKGDKANTAQCSDCRNPEGYRQKPAIFFQNFSNSGK